MKPAQVMGAQVERGRTLEPGLFILAFVILLLTFRDGLSNMLN